MIPKIVLQLKGLNKSFGGLLAVKNVDMLVNESSISGLIGINGAGKTTLMNCISGIYRADSGSLDIMGVSCLNWSPHDIARLGVGRTFQIPRIFKRINLIDNVMVPALNDNTDNKTLYERATECLDKVKLYDLRHNNAEELSGGQQKLLELARIMMFNPSIILLDEPFAGVNPTLCRLMIERIKEMKEQGKSFLLVSHDLTSIYQLSDHIYVLNQGQVISEGNVDYVRNDPEVIEAYLGNA